jgi:hypothetical protein
MPFMPQANGSRSSLAVIACRLVSVLGARGKARKGWKEDVARHGRRHEGAKGKNLILKFIGMPSEKRRVMAFAGTIEARRYSMARQSWYAR